MPHIPPPSDLPPGSIVDAYLRDSGGPRQEASTDQQRSEIEAYCREYSLQLRNCFIDAARSGASTAGRDEFHALIDLTRHRENRPAGLLLWNYARFARDLDDAIYYKAMLRQQGIVIHSLTDPIPEGPYGRVVELVIDISNEDKHRQTSRDTKRGLRKLVQEVGAMPGVPPRGFVRQPLEMKKHRDGSSHTVHRWVVDPPMAPLIRRAFEMLARGESLSRIHEATGLYSSRNSWASFFRNRLYFGELVFKDLVIPNYCEAIVTPELWNLCQHILDMRSRKNSPMRREGEPSTTDPRRQGSSWLLSGLLRCARCGSPMNSHKFNGWTYYACSRRIRRHDCDAPLVRSGLLEAAVIEQARSYLGDPASLAALQSERYRLYREATQDLPGRTKELITRLANIRRQITNITEAIADGRRSPSLMDKLTALEQQEYQLKDELEQLRRLRSSEPAQLNAEQLQELADALKQALANAPAPEARRALAGWIQSIEAERQGDTIVGTVLFFMSPTDQVKKKPSR